MGLKSTIIRAVAAQTRRRIERDASQAVAHQQATFEMLLRKAAGTRFGQDHKFDQIRSHRQFTEQIPLRDYEDLRPYVEAILAGGKDILWPGKPIYFAKTSGTTSGVKYIPITRDSIPYHIGNARDALFNMTSRLNIRDLFDGKLIFLSGSPELDTSGSIPTGRLSGIVNHWVPGWLRTNQMPSYATNCIDDWETKIDRIAEETLKADMRLISGIPPWVQMYYERILALSGKSNIREVFPHLRLFVYGGVNFEPYRAQLERLTGGPVPSLETYPASEGFIAYQDLEDVHEGLLLQCRSGIFYEFVPLNEIHQAHPKRLTLAEVEKDVDYALIMSTNAGLWAYSIGDTVSFVSLNPYRLKVTGRVKHFISAFGEHVIAKEVEEALRLTTERHPCRVNEFTVAPMVVPPDGTKPYHEWWIEFAEAPQDRLAFERDLDLAMTDQNLYYKDLIDGKILRPLVVRYLPPGSFKRYMQSVGKLGGQNKVPRLSNDRLIADALGVALTTG